jgi:hypothetical protein
VLSDVKAKRFEEYVYLPNYTRQQEACRLTWGYESIKARFVKIGYAAEDVTKIRWHREVNMSKPMSDRGTHKSASISSY